MDKTAKIVTVTKRATVNRAHIIGTLDLCEWSGRLRVGAGTTSTEWLFYLAA